MRPITGPKLSSRITAIEWFTSTSTVGSNQLPLPLTRLPPASTFAPFFTASFTCASSTFSCGARVSGPM